MDLPANRAAAATSSAAERSESAGVFLSDVTIAQATEEAIRQVPGVLDLSAGRFVLAATFGAGRHVTGVVVHHPTPDATGIEVHAVLSERYTRALYVHPEDVAGALRGQPVLIAVAEEIRLAVHRVARTLRLPSLAGVDVFIDDLR